MNQKLPKGWTEQELRELADYYDNQSEDEAIAEAEEAYNAPGYAWVQIPNELLPSVRALLYEHEKMSQAKEPRKAPRKR